MPTPDFSRIWGVNSSLTAYQFVDSDYLKGWEFVGSVPPARTQFDAFFKQTDTKLKYLFDSAFTAAQADAKVTAHNVSTSAHDDIRQAIGAINLGNYLPRSGGTLTGDLLIEDSTERQMKGLSSNVGLFWNAGVFGSYDFAQMKDIWAYNEANRVLTFGADGGFVFNGNALFKSKVSFGAGIDLNGGDLKMAVNATKAAHITAGDMGWGINFTSSVMGWYDWRSGVDHWVMTYNPQDRNGTLHMNPLSGTYFSTGASFDGGIHAATEKSTFDSAVDLNALTRLQGASQLNNWMTVMNSPEMGILGDGSQVGIEWHNSNVFCVRDRPNNTYPFAYDNAIKVTTVGTVGANGGELRLASSHGKAVRVTYASTDAPLLYFDNATDNQGILSMDNGKLKIYERGGTWGGIATSGVQFQGNQQVSIGQVSSTDYMFTAWNDTANVRSHARFNNILADGAYYMGSPESARTRIANNSGQSGTLEFGAEDNTSPAKLQWTTPDRALGTSITQVSGGVEKGQLDCNATFNAPAFVMHNVGQLTRTICGAGNMAHGGTVPVPAGFDRSNCATIAAMRDDNPFLLPWDIEESGAHVHYNAKCWVEDDGVVYAQVAGSGTYHNATVNYMIVAVR